MRDKENLQRAELHLHTKLSDGISVISVKDVFEKAQLYGIDTIAFTNLNSVQDFPEIMEYEMRCDIKVIYGAQVHYYNNDTIHNGVTLLARNQAGIKELYKVISSIKNVDGYDLVDVEVLKNNRKNLLVGSCGYEGELYDAMGDNEGEFVAGFYDYFEIYPTADKHEKEVYAKIYALGEKLGIPVVAVSDARYLKAEDAICCNVIRSSNYNFLKEKLLNEKWPKEEGRYLRTTEEMLREFSYLGEKNAKKVVVENSRKIAEMTKKAEPIPHGVYYPCFKDAKHEVAELCFERAYEIYGKPLPLMVEERLRKELELIKNDGIASTYLIAKKLADFVKDNGAFSSMRGLGSSALICYLLGVSEVNPLPSHYYCTHCHYFEDASDVQDGFVLQRKKCPHCTKHLKTDGHNIPAELFMGLYGEKLPGFDLNLPDSIRPKALAYLEEMLGAKNIVPAGIVRTAFEKRINTCITSYESIYNCSFSQDERKNICNKMLGTKCGEYVHPAGFVILPDGFEVEDFTPVSEVRNFPDERRTHFDFSVLRNTLLKLNILSYPNLDMLLKLQEKTGVMIKDIPMNAPEIYEILRGDNTNGIPEFDNEFVRKLCQIVKPADFSELIKMQGLSHGTQVWNGNGEFLFRAGVPIADIPTTREDIFNDLLKVTDRENAYKYTEGISKGYFSTGRFSDDEISKFREITENLDWWYFDFCSDIIYMFPRAHAVEYAIVVARLAWFKVHYPDAFNSVVLCAEENAE